MTALRLFLLAFMALVAWPAQAAITCTALSSSGWTASYLNGTTPSQQTTFTITCNRALSTDPTTLNYSVTVNNGNNFTGQNNYAALVGTTAKFNYDTFTTSCASSWKNNTAISGTVSWTTTGNSQDSRQFWLCVNTGATLTSQGIYTDSVTMTATYNGTQTVSGQIPIQFYAPAFCNITTAPGNINLTYPSFSSSPVSQTTPFATQCTTSMPYSFSIAPSTGTLVGVDYQLAVTSGGTAGAPTCAGAQCSATGTGANQSFTITATAASGQAGTCATSTCSNTQTHTLTITY
ncbi:MAG: hypothetical protein ACXWC6_01930 [Ramlibacter sp.]